MKAKIGNIIADVWEIDPKEPVENYKPWLKEAYDKKLVGWRHDKVAGNWRGGIDILLYDKLVRGKAFAEPESLNPMPDFFMVAGSPGIGGAGDYLLYSEKFSNKYKIVSKHSFEKDYQIVEAEVVR